SRFFARVTDTPMRDARGRIVGVVGVSADLSGRKKLERTVEVERRHLRQAFDRAPALMALLRGPELVFEMANAMYERVVGRSVTGRPIGEALPELAEQGYLDMLERVYRTGRPHVGRESRMLLQRQDDEGMEEVFFNFVYQPLFEADGAVSGILVHAVDVTESVRAREEMEGLYEQVRAANEAKADFLAIISHELRTPLTAVLGYTEILEAEIGGPLTPQQRQQVGRIRESGRHLLDLIEEILGYARADAGAEEVRPQPVPVAALTRECISMVDVRARDRGLTLEAALPPDDERIVTDPRLLRQILLNLLSNAVKFTEEGGVRVDVEIGDRWATFEVSDTGVGIPEDQLERIFEPFQQTQAVLTRSSAGTGLGLAVVRKLAGLLGGGVTVRSEAGRGSSFVVRVPARREGAASSE
ncbi:MAG TPA: ATP-binding protein, partial [Longimicrobiales bacterium]|nr:ATP-binding protein [Longimicrobiales bacterium]